jgi:hypothetical protein
MVSLLDLIEYACGKNCPSLIGTSRLRVITWISREGREEAMIADIKHHHPFKALP